MPPIEYDVLLKTGRGHFVSEVDEAIKHSSSELFELEAPQRCTQLYRGPSTVSQNRSFSTRDIPTRPDLVGLRVRREDCSVFVLLEANHGSTYRAPPPESWRGTTPGGPIVCLPMTSIVERPSGPLRPRPRAHTPGARNDRVIRSGRPDGVTRIDN